MLDSLEARLFPDIAHGRTDLVTAAAIYFDRLIVPPLPPKGLEIEPETPLWKTLERHGLDMQAGYSRSVELLQLTDVLRGLIVEGIVTPEDLMPAGATQEWLDLLNDSVNDDEICRIVDKAAASAGVFVSTSVSFHQPRPAKDAAVLARIEYIMEAYRAILASAKRGHHLATTSSADYDAIRALQRRCERGGETTTASAVLELVRLALPTISARSSEEILEIRERLREYLDPFRIEMARIAATFTPGRSGEELRHEVRRALDRDVRPRVEELRRYLEKPSRAFARQLSSDAGIIALSSVTILGAVISGFPASAALVAGPFVHLLASALKARSERLERMANCPFTFAILAEQEAQRF